MSHSFERCNLVLPSLINLVLLSMSIVGDIGQWDLLYTGGLS
jgi:hypothetical protein